MAEQATLKETLRGIFALEKVVAHGSHILAIAVVSWLLYFLVKRAIRTAARAADARVDQEARRQRITTVLLLVGSVVRYVIIFMALVMVLRDIGVNLTPILAGAGVVGLAVGFGAQNLVRDVVSGFFIIMEAQYAVGDLVEINGVLGRVEEVGLRITKVRDPNGQLRYFANGSIATANNYTEDYVGYVVNIPLPPEEPASPAEFARELFRDFDREFRVFAEPPTVQPVESLQTYARLLRVRANAIPGRHTIVEQKLPARVTAALERAGHSVPSGTEVTVSLLFPPPGART
jgi:small-conductance mechanosensitive channel